MLGKDEKADKTKITFFMFYVYQKVLIKNTCFIKNVFFIAFFSLIKSGENTGNIWAHRKTAWGQGAL